MEMDIRIRTYSPDDCMTLWELFYGTVHTVCSQNYTSGQLDAWTGDGADLAFWNQRFLEERTLVAEDPATRAILGFGSIDRTGYLDFLYVHMNHQGEGIGTKLCDVLEKGHEGNLTVHASITARPFFEARGYHLVKELHVKRQGVTLLSFAMEKK